MVKGQVKKEGKSNPEAGKIQWRWQAECHRGSQQQIQGARGAESTLGNERGRQESRRDLEPACLLQWSYQPTFAWAEQMQSCIYTCVVSTTVSTQILGMLSQNKEPQECRENIHPVMPLQTVQYYVNICIRLHIWEHSFYFLVGILHSNRDS